MAKKLSIKALIVLFFASLALPVQALFSINHISVSNIDNGSAKIRWQSSEPSNGYIYYGTAANSLDQIIGHTTVENWHETTINNLKKRTTYYYKIVAISANGQNTESFLQNFYTGEMSEAMRAPDTLSLTIKQVTHDAVAVYWQTDIPARASIKYYYDNGPQQQTTVWDYTKQHNLYLYNLTPNKHYYLIIDAESETKGHKIASAAFNTFSTPSNAINLNLTDLQPLSVNSDLIKSDQITISWTTNLVAKSNILYGTTPGRLNNKLNVNAEANLNHQITLKNLKANTNYYYKIELYDTLYGKYALTEEKNFITKPLSPAEIEKIILGEKIIKLQAAAQLDSDNDGLTDNYEVAIGTNPNVADSDRDGFNDKQEIDNNFNPLGYGRTLIQIERALSNKRSMETKKAKQLFSWLPYQKSTPKNWNVLVNAYIFGGYPVEDIRLAAKGKTNVVNASVPYKIWKDSAEYKQAKK